MGLFKKRPQEEEPQQLYVGPAIYEAIAQTGSIPAGLEDDDEWTCLVGESFYQEDLELVSGGRGRYGTELDEVLALIAFEPRNQYDANAIRCSIAGRLVGYIAKDDQPRVAAAIRKAGAFKGNGSFVRARFIGGWDNGPDDQGLIGVELDIP